MDEEAHYCVFCGKKLSMWEYYSYWTKCEKCYNKSINNK